MWPEVERDLPISQRENILLAFDHKKPKWMPDIYGDTYFMRFPVCHDGPANMKGDSEDWFGVQFKYSELQGSPTPRVGVFDEIYEWKEKVKWPDMDAMDWSTGLEGFEIDPRKAFAVRNGNGLFERFHMFEPFENAITDLITEPELCHELFMAEADYKTAIYDHMHALYDFDYVMYNDDWGTSHGPFFSTDLYEQTLLEPTLKYLNHVKESCPRLAFHNCGKIESFIPYLVEEIGADVLEIQPLNDIEGIMRKYGDRVSIVIQPDPYVMFDPDTTEAEAAAHARALVDRYGAQNFDGAGAIIAAHGGFENTYRAFVKELYDYSSKVYSRL